MEFIFVFGIFFGGFAWFLPLVVSVVLSFKCRKYVRNYVDQVGVHGARSFVVLGKLLFLGSAIVLGLAAGLSLVFTSAFDLHDGKVSFRDHVEYFFLQIPFLLVFFLPTLVVTFLRGRRQKFVGMEKH